MPLHQRKIKLITFALDSETFECQIRSWMLNNNTSDGEVIYTLCPDGESREEVDPDWSIDLTFLDDWRENGISDYLTVNDGELATVTIDHHPDIPAEHVRWTGEVKLRAPSVGGEARATEQHDITLPCTGKPVYSRVGV